MFFENDQRMDLNSGSRRKKIFDVKAPFRVLFLYCFCTKMPLLVQE